MTTPNSPVSTALNTFLRPLLVSMPIVVALTIYAIFPGDSHKQHDQPQATTPLHSLTPLPQSSSSARHAEPSPTVTFVEPPSANVTLRAFDLLTNPFPYRNHTVVLSAMERPVLYHGSVVQYVNIGGTDARLATQLSLMGLRLNRMITEDTALYDILGKDADYNSGSEPLVLGQLAVVLPSGRTDLDLGRYWVVEPLGAMKGTNAFGGQVQAPQIRFLHYTDER
jgi:hypothetical protein